MAAGEDTAGRSTVISDYRKKLLDLRELRVGTVRGNLKNAKEFSKIEDYLDPIESVGEITGEVLCPFDNEHFIVDASCGPRYCRSEVDKEKLTSGTRVILDMATLTIIRTAPVPKKVDYSMVCEELRKIKELLELPLKYPELFRGIAIEPPKVNRKKIASIWEDSTHVACSRPIVIRNGHAERCPGATTPYKKRPAMVVATIGRGSEQPAFRI